MTKWVDSLAPWGRSPSALLVKCTLSSATKQLYHVIVVTGPAHQSWLNHVTELNLNMNQSSSCSTSVEPCSGFLRRPVLMVPSWRGDRSLPRDLQFSASFQLDSRPLCDATCESLASLSDSEEVTEMDWEDQSGRTSASQNSLLSTRRNSASIPLRPLILRSPKRKRHHHFRWMFFSIVLLSFVTVCVCHFTLNSVS